MSAASFPHLTCIELSKAERIKMLDGTSWHQEFTWGELETLSTYTEAYQAAVATTLVREDSREAFMGIVIEGQLDVLKRDQSGINRIIAQIRAGKTLGEMSLVDGEPRHAAACQPRCNMQLATAVARHCCPTAGLKFKRDVVCAVDAFDDANNPNQAHALGVQVLVLLPYSLYSPLLYAALPY